MQRTKGPRLHLRPAHGTRSAVWIIKDGQDRHSTGCGFDDIERARQALAHYLASTHTPPAEEEPLVTEVLAIYRREVEPKLNRPDLIQYSVRNLVTFWGDDLVSAIKKPKCEAYVKWRCKMGVSLTTARHDLKNLRAAINHYHETYGLKVLPVVTLPEKTEGRVRWLTRDEAARLLRAARSLGLRYRHLARFILIGLYTGTRSQAMLGLTWVPSTGSGWIDLDKGVLYRRGEAQRQTNKKQPPAAIPDRLMAHLRRWHRQDTEACVKHVIHYQGSRVQKLRRSWAAARAAAGLGVDVVPHTLRHTAATWLMQEATEMWEAAGYLGMSLKMLEEVYGHHHPDFQAAIRGAFRPPNRPPSGRGRRI
jgi:integrase